MYSENHKKLTNTLCGENAEVMIIKVGGTDCCYHWALKC
jgi:hypothetical protein